MKILVVYYSMYGHVLKLARAAAEGAKTVAGAEVVLRRVQELDSNLAKLQGSKHAQAVLAQQQDIPIATVDDLKAADGVIFGTPTRFGNMCAQMKQYIDGTVDLWLSGALEGKPAGVMVSTATTHGGQETTCLTMMAPLLHLGFHHRRGALFHPGHAPHRGPGRHPLRRHHGGRGHERPRTGPGRPFDRQGPGAAGSRRGQKTPGVRGPQAYVQ